MKKEDLMKIEGMTEEIAAAVVEKYGADIPKARFDEVNEAKKNAEALIKERDKQLEDLKKSSGDTKALQDQITALQEAHRAAKTEYDASIKKMQIDHAVDSALRESGAKNIKAVMALLDGMDKAELSEDGSVKGLAEQIAKLQKDNDYLFNIKASAPQAKGAAPAQGTAGTPSAATQWQTRLAEARKKGNNLEAIAIKREAREAGINLL